MTCIYTKLQNKPLCAFGINSASLTALFPRRLYTKLTFLFPCSLQVALQQRCAPFAQACRERLIQVLNDRLCRVSLGEVDQQDCFILHKNLSQSAVAPRFKAKVHFGAWHANHNAARSWGLYTFNPCCIAPETCCRPQERRITKQDTFLSSNDEAGLHTQSDLLYTGGRLDVQSSCLSDQAQGNHLESVGVYSDF